MFFFFLTKVHLSPRSNPIKFGNDPDHRLNPGGFLKDSVNTAINLMWKSQCVGEYELLGIGLHSLSAFQVLYTLE